MNTALNQAWDLVNGLEGHRNGCDEYTQGYLDAVDQALERIEAIGAIPVQRRLIKVLRPRGAHMHHTNENQWYWRVSYSNTLTCMSGYAATAREAWEAVHKAMEAPVIAGEQYADV